MQCVSDNPCPAGEVQSGTGSSAKCVPVNCEHGREPDGDCSPPPLPPPPCPSGQTRNSQGFCCPDSCPQGCSAQSTSGGCSCQDDPCPPQQTRGGDCGNCERTDCATGQIRCTPTARCTPTPDPCPSGQTRSRPCNPCVNNPCPPNQRRPPSGGDCVPFTRPACPENEEYRTPTSNSCVCKSGFRRNNQGRCSETGQECPPCQEKRSGEFETDTCYPLSTRSCEVCDSLTGNIGTLTCPPGQECVSEAIRLGTRSVCRPRTGESCPPCQIRRASGGGCNPIRCTQNRSCNPSTGNCECDSTSPCPPCQFRSSSTCSCQPISCPRNQFCDQSTGSCETPDCGPCQRYNSRTGSCRPLICGPCRECSTSSDSCQPMDCPRGQVCRNGSCQCSPCPPCNRQLTNCACSFNCPQGWRCNDEGDCENVDTDIEFPECEPDEFYDPQFGCRPETAPPTPACPVGQVWDRNALGGARCVPSSTGPPQQPCPPCGELERCNFRTGQCEGI